MDYMIAKEVAEKWGITPRWVQVLCAQGKIPGVVRFGVTCFDAKSILFRNDG